MNKRSLEGQDKSIPLWTELEWIKQQSIVC